MVVKRQIKHVSAADSKTVTWVVKAEGATHRRRAGAPKSFWLRKLEQFCNRTDLHGYKYIVMPEFTPLERSCWAVAVFASVVVAAYLVYTAYNWYARNPIVTVIESTHGAIWNIPFPGVTFCDVNYVSRSNALALAKNLTSENMTAEEVFEALSFVPLLHSAFRESTHQRAGLLRLQAVLDQRGIGTRELFRRISPAASCGKLVQRCMWKNAVYRCDELFEEVFTEFGMCCSFNLLAVRKATKLSATDSGREPRRVASCGYQTALTVLLNNRPEDYYSATVASFGIMLLIDNSYNLPDLDSPLRLVGPTSEVFVSLTPESTYATAGLRSFSPKDRQCYFKDEVELSPFRYYSYHNCIIYRKKMLMNETCGCIPFFYPDYHSKERVCNFNDIDCLKSFKKSVAIFQAVDPTRFAVDCLPDCEHVDYPIEIALGMLAPDAPLEGLLFFKDTVLKNQSVVNVFFNDLVTTRYRRDIYLNWQNLLASFGGLLSLMLGFTLISAFDLVIFFTFRVTYDLVTEVVLPRRNRVQGGSEARTQRDGWVTNKRDQIWISDIHRF